jgi:lysophospholipase L1-like esterase
VKTHCRPSFRPLFLLAAVCAATACSFAANTAIEPVPRGGSPAQMHKDFVALAQKGGIDVLFLGDSITDFWRTRGKAVWEKYYGSMNAANFGISADRTQHVLWRLNNGEVDGIKPKVVVLLIGTNNTGVETNGSPRNTTAEAVEGVSMVVRTLRAKLPESRILLLGIFPRADPKGPPPGSTQIKDVNAGLAKLDDGKFIRFLDIGPKFLKPDGTPNPDDFVSDLLHPSEKGYEVWAEAIKEPLAALLK